MENQKLYHLAVMGATGAVGEKIREILAERKFPLASIRFLASPRSSSREILFQGKKYPVIPVSETAFEGVDFVLSSTPGAISKQWSPLAVKAGAIVIDNSSAWRMDPDVPLVVPEVNSASLSKIRKGIVANPNCSTIQLVVALGPLHRAAGIKRVVVCTYQASSGRGATGLTELDAQMTALGKGETLPAPKAHAAHLAGNVVTHDWSWGDDGYSEEESKIIKETCKILGDDSIAVSPTTARVGVRTGHSEAVHVEFHRAISADEARKILRNAPGVIVQDDMSKNEFPTPLAAEGRDEVFVGRIRKDPTVPHGLALWVVADNLRKGAATNAVQILEAIVKQRSV